MKDLLNISDKNKEDIGFSYIMNQLHLHTFYGKKIFRERTYYSRQQEEELNFELNLLDRYNQIVIKYPDVINEIFYRLAKLRDIHHTVQRCLTGETLDIVELYELKIQALHMEELRTILQSKKGDLQENLRGIDDFALHDLGKVIQYLDPDNNKLPTFHISSSYSKDLKHIREEKKTLENQIEKAVNDQEKKILHRKRLNFILKEQAEETRICQQLSLKLQKYMPVYKKNINKIAWMDYRLAKACLTKRLGGCKPSIKKDGAIILKKITNPQIQELLKQEKRKFTPLDIEINSGTTVITGANMGGKTVALKTISLNLLLAHMGFFVFAEYAEIPLCDFILFTSDDMQDVSKGLSTFAAEMNYLKKSLIEIKQGTGFMALDEFARGTNPVEGQKIVKSVTKYLNQFSSYSVLTSHYDGIVTKGVNHYQVIGLKNVSFNDLRHLFNLDTSLGIKQIQHYMNYQLKRVDNETEVPKEGLKIAKLIGVDHELIQLIEENLGGSHHGSTSLKDGFGG